MEEIAILFGDKDEIVVYSEDIHIDNTTHELVIGEHGNAKVSHVATEATRPTESKDIEERAAFVEEHIEKSNASTESWVPLQFVLSSWSAGQ